MVLDTGKIVRIHVTWMLYCVMYSSIQSFHQVEFGKPSELLKNEKGFLRALVDESGDKEALYAMAEKGAEN